MNGRNGSLRREPSVAIADPISDHCPTFILKKNNRRGWK